MKHKLIIFLALFFVLIDNVYSHQSSTSYLSLYVDNETITGSWQADMQDINLLQALDINNNGEITWGELWSQTSALHHLLNDTININTSQQQCPFIGQDLQLENRLNSVFVVIPFKLDCSGDRSIKQLNYHFLFNQDRSHKAIISLTQHDQTQIKVLDNEHQQWIIQSNTQTLQQWRHFIQQGIWHIWIGWDHILFLLSLLLAAFYSSKEKSTACLQHRFNRIFKIITAFTLSHSITLTLAAMHWVSLPVDWIETAIAASVVLLAVHNIKPILPFAAWQAAFIFGFIHGFGFANVLSHIELSDNLFIMSLLAFNLGVEIGQLVLVGGFIGISIVLDKRPYYYRYILPVGSSLIACVGMFWLVERSLKLTF